jgi:hypothetical protein
MSSLAIEILSCKLILFLMYGAGVLRYRSYREQFEFVDALLSRHSVKAG